MYIIVIMEYAVVDANIRKFYFFVGRATPPHSGHIQVIQETIKLARAGRTRALILLGDGPAGGLRTRANPIEHDTKADFIRHRLGMLGYQEQRDYIILKKDDRPVGQVARFVSNGIPENVTEISISQVAGDKDDDATKLEWILPHSCERVQKLLYPRQIQISNGGVRSISPKRTANAEKAMSATFVRETAVACYASAGNDMDKAFEGWLERVDAFPFYSEDGSSRILSKTMFEQIIKYKDIISEKGVIQAADDLLKEYNYNIKDAITVFLRRFTCYEGHEPTLLLLRNRFEQIIASRSKSVATSDKRYVTTTSAKPNTGSGSAETSSSSKKSKPSGGSRRKHTRRRASNLRIKKTLRTNRRHNKHRHTRRRN
jgi:nicotinamide mononucleotide adenylyltransferase